MGFREGGVLEINISFKCMQFLRFLKDLGKSQYIWESFYFNYTPSLGITYFIP